MILRFYMLFLCFDTFSFSLGILLFCLNTLVLCFYTLFFCPQLFCLCFQLVLLCLLLQYTFFIALVRDDKQSHQYTHKQ